MLPAPAKTVVSFAAFAMLLLALAGCSPAQLQALAFAEPTAPTPAVRPQVVAANLGPVSPQRGPREDINRLIAEYAARYDIPADLVHAVVKRESSYNPAARNGPYYGLMQISYPTARTMGYRGEPSGLLDARTNLNYAVKYLAGAYMVGDNNHGRAMRLYASGYYYDAKRKGLLEEVGLR